MFRPLIEWRTKTTCRFQLKEHNPQRMECRTTNAIVLCYGSSFRPGSGKLWVDDKRVWIVKPIYNTWIYSWGDNWCLLIIVVMPSIWVAISVDILVSFSRSALAIFPPASLIYKTLNAILLMASAHYNWYWKEEGKHTIQYTIFQQRFSQHRF